MSSCHSLIAKPPRKDFEKALSKDRLTLRFAAHMDTSRRGDADRSFIVSYYLSDDTVGVFEPAVKNSGIVGGKFLQRAKFRRTDGDFFEPTDFFVGATVTINAHRFVLEDVDEATLNYTEGHPDEYPMSDIELVIGKLVTAISKGLVTVEALFKMADADGSKTITAPELKTFLNETVGATLTGQEVLTLTRHFDVGGDGTINLDEFRAVLDRPVPHRHSPEYVERTTAEGEDAKARSALADVRRAFWNRRGLLAQAFRIVDRDFTGEVKKIAFKEAMAMAATKAHMTLSPEEIRRVTDLIFGKEDTVSITDTLAFIFA
jgi:Ca2+-binding EF-hand superfamily protein